MKALVKKFNQTHPDIQVNGVFVGSYDAAVTRSNRLPAFGCPATC